MSKRLTVAERREIFQDLVTTQDRVHDVPQSRLIVTKKFSITEAQLKKIEDEGISRQWPPLDDGEEVTADALEATEAD